MNRPRLCATSSDSDQGGARATSRRAGDSAAIHCRRNPLDESQPWTYLRAQGVRHPAYAHTQKPSMPQVFFSRRNPMLRRGLALRLRVLYSHGTWAYVVNIATTATFLLIPFTRPALPPAPPLPPRVVMGRAGGELRFPTMHPNLLTLSYPKPCSLVFGLAPITFSMIFAAASLAHLVTGQLLTSFCREPGQLRTMWFVGISNTLLAFTFAKAITSTLL